MATTDSRVTIHMAASLDGFIARSDGRVDWLETADEFADRDIELHLMEVKGYKSGMVELCYEVRGHRDGPGAAVER